MLALLWVVLLAAPIFAQSTCPTTPTWSPCDFFFDLEPTEDAAHVELLAEFRSPRHRTFLMYAVRDADRRFVIRFSPTEPGDWIYHVTSNLPRLDGKKVHFQASESDSPGFVRVANVHHFAYEGTNKGHLWMAAPFDHFAEIPRPEFDGAVEQRVKEKFTHLRLTVSAGTDLREAADRVRAINAKGLVADLVLASIPEDREKREAYLADIVARFSGMNVTWMGVPAFEDLAHPKAMLK